MDKDRIQEEEEEEQQQGDAWNRILRPVQALNCLIREHKAKN
jgi:hypothetical protein